MSSEAFATWLRQRLRLREWRPADLARESSINSGTISRWLSGQDAPSPENCIRLAEALNVDSDDVLALAGHRIPHTPPSPDDPVSEISRMLRGIRLTEDRVAMIKAIINTYKQTDRDSHQSRLLPAA